MITLVVAFGRDTYKLPVTLETRVDAVNDTLAGLTGVAPRSQKLIFKGVVLLPASTLGAAKIKDGSKVMLMSSKGGVQSAGQAAAAAAAADKQRKLAAAAALLPTAVDDHPDVARRSSGPQASSAQQTRAAAWTATGIVALRDAGLSELPSAALAVGAAARVLDAAGNQLTELPEAMASLTSLQRLRLSANRLSAAGVPSALFDAWRRTLTVLALDDNRLERLPDAIGLLQALKQLTVARNALQQLPTSVGGLRCLQLLDVSGNRLSAMPAELGQCSALSDVDARNNQIAAIPPEWTRLGSLKVLTLDNNRVTKVPPEVFVGCGALTTLSLHHNPVTVEQLREMDGYAAFNARRLAKVDKQIEMRTLLNRDGLDEGADAADWQRWLSPCERLPDDLLLRVLEHVMLRLDGLKSWSGAVRGVNRRWRAVHDAACTRLCMRDGVTDDTMHVLCGRLPALTWLSLSGVQSLTADGLSAVGGLTALTRLNLFNCVSVTDVVLRELRGLTALSDLILYGCSLVTDRGLRELRGLPALNRLSLTDVPNVTDAGLKHLTSLTALTMLYLPYTSTTQAGRAALKAALPALSIVFFE